MNTHAPPASRALVDRPHAAASLILLAAALVSESAAAQQAGANPNDATLDDIVVTAQRRTESVLDVPIAITALDAAALEKQSVQSIEEVLDDVPNVSFVSQGSRDRKEISMRGISNQLNPYTAVRSSTYAFYIDEFNVAVGTSNPEIVDLERVEVLRGPQGTYFGRNAVGGALNVITN